MEDAKNCKQRDEIRKKQKKVRARRKWLKKQYYRGLAEEMNCAAEARAVEKEFALAKKFTALKVGNKVSISTQWEKIVA